MADPVVGIVNGVPTSGTGTITTLGQTLLDGAQVTQGAIADAAVTAGATGSISAKLRSISRDLVAATPAGTNLIGKVGIDQTTPGTTNGVSVTNANANGQATMANSAPVVIASNQAAIPATMAITATANGATASRVLATASNNLTSVKASAGQLYTIDVFNVAAYNVFLKLYNKASAPVVASDTPIITIPIQAGGGYSKTWPMGLSFATGIAYAIVKLQADTDATNVVAGDLTGNLTWI